MCATKNGITVEVKISLNGPEVRFFEVISRYIECQGGDFEAEAADDCEEMLEIFKDRGFTLGNDEDGFRVTPEGLAVYKKLCQVAPDFERYVP